VVSRCTAKRRIKKGGKTVVRKPLGEEARNKKRKRRKDITLERKVDNRVYEQKKKKKPTPKEDTR